MKTLVVGLGNPILGDDGVGCKVAKEVRKHLTSPTSPSQSTPAGLLEEVGNSVDVVCLSVGGTSLMEHLIGYDRVILVDVSSADAPAGSISVLRLSQLPDYSAYHISSDHNTTLQKAMEMGRDMGAHLPEDVMIVGISTESIHDFSEDLSPPVARVVPCVVKIVLDLLKEFSKEEQNQGYLQG